LVGDVLVKIRKFLFRRGMEFEAVLHLLLFFR
jgi:hypothetical protein